MLPTLQIDGHVAYLTLRRPQAANKLTPEDLPAIVGHLETVNGSAGVLVLVVRSEGKYFCSGYDISEVAASSQTEGRSFGEMVDALENCRAVTIAAVHGGVFGGATDLVLACDLCIGLTGIEFRMPATALGLHYYPGGLRRFIGRLGVSVWWSSGASASVEVQVEP